MTTTKMTTARTAPNRGRLPGWLAARLIVTTTLSVAVVLAVGLAGGTRASDPTATAEPASGAAAGSVARVAWSEPASRPTLQARGPSSSTGQPSRLPGQPSPLQCSGRPVNNSDTGGRDRSGAAAIQIDIVVDRATERRTSPRSGYLDRAGTDSPLVVQCGPDGGLVVMTCDTQRGNQDRDRYRRDNNRSSSLDRGDYRDKLDRLDRLDDRGRRGDLDRLSDLADIVGLDLDELTDLAGWDSTNSRADGVMDGGVGGRDGRAIVIGSDGQVYLGHATGSTARTITGTGTGATGTGATGTVGESGRSGEELEAVAAPGVGDLLVGRSGRDGGCRWQGRRR